MLGMPCVTEKGCWAYPRGSALLSTPAAEDIKKTKQKLSAQTPQRIYRALIKRVLLGASMGYES